jgi:molybdopterin-binding protein
MNLCVPSWISHVIVRVAAFVLPNRFTLYPMTKFRIAEVAELLGVSDDTVRRWIDGGRLPVERDQSRRMVIDGATLAVFAQSLAHPPRDTSRVGRSARNHFVGLVTNVITDTVMTQIELQCGPHRVVSLMSTEAARELGLEPGSLAVAVVKSTQVLIEIPSKPPISMPDDPETTSSPKSVEASG